MKFDDIFKANDRREHGGWVTRGFADLPGLKLKVRAENSEVVTKRIREVTDAASEEHRKTEEFQDGLIRTVILDAVLLDWSIEETPYSREAAEKLLETAVFRDAVTWASRVVAAIGSTTLEADTGN